MCKGYLAPARNTCGPSAHFAIRHARRETLARLPIAGVSRSRQKFAALTQAKGRGCAKNGTRFCEKIHNEVSVLTYIEVKFTVTQMITTAKNINPTPISNRSQNFVFAKHGKRRPNGRGSHRNSAGLASNIHTAR